MDKHDFLWFCEELDCILAQIRGELRRFNDAVKRCPYPTIIAVTAA